MKKVLTLFLLTFSVILFAQKEKTEVEYFENTALKVTSLKISSGSVKELENINWIDLKSVFESNKKTETIKLVFEIDLKDSKNKFKGSFSIKDKTQNIDSLITRAKKMLKSLIKISKNY
ncbi:hypothetical protein SHK09_09800 [Polaribacter sp. PL03]|uniref:hypothetical protein n=1 Tax=Polaribacter sp. PL03 TaxID=3088353 RepID=UPI0029CACF98|nr:hypothetical protein [Polaribacter sp. PL03]MDX6747083.1 hypothetical protein [Polaribacter sp. PL03]